MTNPLRDRVEEVLRTHAAPALGVDPADLEVVEVTDGVATVRLGDTCSSCAGGVTAVVAALEAELRRHVPGVEFVEPVR